MKVSSNEWRELTRPLLLLCVASLACYVPALEATLFSDDNIYLAFKNALVREAHWASLGQFFVAPSNPWEYLPLRDITYWLDFQLYADESFGFHLTNLLWYAVASGTVWWLFRELLLLCGTAMVGNASTVALIGMFIFTVHPAHVEAVAWVASRKDLVGGVLSMVVLALATRFVRSGAGSVAWAMLGLLLLMASFGKSTAMVQVIMVAAVMLAASNLKPRDERLGLLIGLMLVLVPTVVAWFIHSTIAVNTGIRLENEIGGLAMIERGSRILAQLIWMLVFPISLGFYHDPYNIGEWHWLLSLVVLLLNGAALISLYIRPQLWAFGVLLISVSLLPYMQFVPYSTWSLASERFLFVAVAGLAMITTDLASRVLAPKTVLVLLLAIMTFCAVVIFERLQDWRSVDQLRLAEQDRLPGFPNSKRDLIVYRLLPDRQYEAALAVAVSLPRDYLRDLMTVYVQYREVSDVGCFGGAIRALELIRSREAAVWAAVARAHAAIRTEHDLSLNNIVRWIEQNMPRGNTIACGGDQTS